MAPEQFDGREGDQRVDIYSFGIMSYEIAAGNPPFQHANPVALARLHKLEPLPRLSGVPAWYTELIEACTQKDPRDRMPSIAEAAEVLGLFLKEHGVNNPAEGQS